MAQTLDGTKTWVGLLLILIGAVGLCFVTSAGASGVTVAPPPGTPLVIFSDAPSEVEIGKTWFGGVAPPQCIMFNVYVLPPTTVFSLTTSGLGQAELFEGSQAGCPSPAAAWKQEITISDWDKAGQYALALRLDPHTDPPGDQGLAGTIIAFDQHGTLGTAGLNVRSGAQSTILQALQWCIGFALPALFGVGLTQAVLKFQARRQATEDFEKFRALDVTAINNALAGVRIVLQDPEIDHPGRLIYEEIKNAGVLEKLPPKKRRFFVDFCYKDDMDKIMALLTELFPAQSREVFV